MDSKTQIILSTKMIYPLSIKFIFSKLLKRN